MIKRLFCKKKILFFLVLILIVVLISIYFTFFHNRPKNEDEILTELESNEKFFPYCDLSINDIKILKRQTNKKNKSDNIFVEVNASNNELGVNCILSYELNYLLYNDGWVLEEIKKYNDGKWEVSKPGYDLVLNEVYKVFPFFEKNGVSFDELATIEYTDISPESTQTAYTIDFSAEKDMDTFIAQSAGTLVFELGEKGWECDQTQLNIPEYSNRLIPKDDPGEDAARKIADQYKDERISELTLDYSEFRQDDQAAYYSFSGIIDFNYLTLMKKYDVWCYFNNDTASWEFKEPEITEFEDWKIVSHIYETKMPTQDFSGSIEKTIRFRIESFNGNELYADYQDPRYGSESDIDGYYTEAGNDWSVKSIGDYKYMCTILGYDTSKFALIIDKDNGLSVKRLPWSGAGKDGAFQDPANDEQKSTYYKMTEVK